MCSCSDSSKINVIVDNVTNKRVRCVLDAKRSIENSRANDGNELYESGILKRAQFRRNDVCDSTPARVDAAYNRFHDSTLHVASFKIAHISNRFIINRFLSSFFCRKVERRKNILGKYFCTRSDTYTKLYIYILLNIAISRVVNQTSYLQYIICIPNITGRSRYRDSFVGRCCKLQRGLMSFLFFS